MKKNNESNRRVVVTGLGVVSSIGIGWEEFWKNLLDGKSGISQVESFDTSKHDRHFAGEVKGDFMKFLNKNAIKRYGRASQMALAASNMAIFDANIEFSRTEQYRTAVCVGTTTGEIGLLEKLNDSNLTKSKIDENILRYSYFSANNLSVIIASELNLSGPNLVFSTACASGNNSIGAGFDFIKSGKSDFALVGGADGISRIVFTGFCRLMAVAPNKCQPFDLNRKRMLPGEGAGILFLEDFESAKKRGVSIYAEILGHGMSCDASHMTNPESEGIAKAINKTLKYSKIKPNEINYISTHGTGTIENDKAECSAYYKVFGNYVKLIPVSSIKSMIGHTMGAASALEAISCCLSFNDVLPPTINFESPDPLCDLDIISKARQVSETNYVLNCSEAFGGNNYMTLFSRIGIQ